MLLAATRCIALTFALFLSFVLDFVPSQFFHFPLCPARFESRRPQFHGDGRLSRPRPRGDNGQSQMIVVNKPV